MRWVFTILLGAALMAVLVVLVAGVFPGLIWRDLNAVDAGFKPDIAHGAYLFGIGGCRACHTAPQKDAPLLGGGRVLQTPFGPLSVPNISPDRVAGIGTWRAVDFLRAMRLGLSPEGQHYYPAFPYPSYTHMTRGDLLDLWAYLRSLPPVSKAAKRTALPFPFNIRSLIGGWKLLFFSAGKDIIGRNASRGQERGAYLVNGPGHCAECHTRRNFLGGWVRSDWLAGTGKGPGGKPVPGITGEDKTGLGKWTQDDIVFALKYGMLPDGDVVGGEMGLVVEQNLAGLSDDDAKAMADYLKSLK